MGFLDLFKSERGIILLLLLVASTVLTAIGRMTVDQWTTFNEIVFGAYVVGKSATGVAAIITDGKKTDALTANTSASGDDIIIAK